MTGRDRARKRKKDELEAIALGEQYRQPRQGFFEGPFARLADDVCRMSVIR
jgi:hypothetical protein